MTTYSSGAPALLLAGVEQRYRTHLGLRSTRVLCGIDLRLERGGVLGLAGPNGSGKTTLLRLCTGIERPSAGSIEVSGLPPRAAAARGIVGWLPEDAIWPPELSLRAALRLSGSIQGLAGRDLHQRADALLGRVGLSANATRRIARCSRGMLRRFGLAQAWLHEPALVLLDEPTAGLDAEGFGVLAALLDEARARGTAVVLSSHLASDLTDRCDELAVVLGGRIRVRGAPRDVLADGGLLGAYRRAAGVAP